MFAAKSPIDFVFFEVHQKLLQQEFYSACNYGCFLKSFSQIHVEVSLLALVDHESKNKRDSTSEPQTLRTITVTYTPYFEHSGNLDCTF